MKILYLPIMETGSVHDIAFAQKRGLYTALAKAGHSVVEYDYLNWCSREWFGTEILMSLLGHFDPDLIISQFHGPDILTPERIHELKNSYNPNMRWVNWSGDSWAHSLTAQPILDMAREFDLQLVAAPDCLPIYEAAGINAAYWNIALERPVGKLPDMPTYDVVFLANVINDERLALMKFLKSLDVRVGIYGDWSEADGRNVYNFAEGEVLYRNATIAIADNVYQDTQNYISNRPMQIMAAGGAICLHQHVPKMKELSGWDAGRHYIEWVDLDDLGKTIQYLLKVGKSVDYQHMVSNAQKHVLEHHTWEARVNQLFNQFLPAMEKA